MLNKLPTRSTILETMRFVLKYCFQKNILYFSCLKKNWPRLIKKIEAYWLDKLCVIGKITVMTEIIV